MIQHNSGLSALDFLRRNIVVLVISGAFVISMTMGLRSSFGLFLGPMSADLDFDRSTFGFAMALQNLLWGAFQPFSGMIADRYGSGRVLVWVLSPMPWACMSCPVQNRFWASTSVRAG